MKRLHEWFDQNKRDLPWRKTPSPYQVWVSEVMLQQTRASVVIPYFERWLNLFPDVFALASAPAEKVIKAWEGLGYYSRARNLAKGAQQIVREFGGRVPETKEALSTISGLGPYTVGAILSFGFHQKAAAVDGNVTRVIARYFAIEENVDRQAVKRKIETLVEQLLDPEAPWVTMEAFIELGATVCVPKPRCDVCPLAAECRGQKRAEGLPIKNRAAQITQLRRAVVCIEAAGKLLVKRSAPGALMADLYEFPYFEMGEEDWPLTHLLKKIKADFGFSVAFLKKLPKVNQSFTRYKATLYPYLLRGNEMREVEGYQWVEREKLKDLPFSSGHRKLL